MADLVVEDGNGLANADAYASREAVLAYWTARADTVFSAAASDGVRDAAIRRASQFIDIQWGDRFKGARKTETQALEWPRIGVETREGWEVAGLPPQIVTATAELAKLALSGPLAGSGASATAPSKSSIASVQAGSVAVTYTTATKTALETDHADKFYLIERILRPIMRGGTVNRGSSR